MATQRLRAVKPVVSERSVTREDVELAARPRPTGHVMFGGLRTCVRPMYALGLMFGYLPIRRCAAPCSDVLRGGKLIELLCLLAEPARHCRHLRGDLTQSPG
jgi:hypothetical protein